MERHPYVHGLEDPVISFHHYGGSTSQLVYRFSAVLVKIIGAFYSRINKLTLNVMLKCKGPRVAKTALKRKNKAGGLHIS